MIETPRKPAVLLLLLLTSSFLISGCTSHHAGVRQDLDTLKEGQNKIVAQLAEMEKLLKQGQPAKRKQAFKPQDVSIKGINFLGKADAPVTLIEFTDYHCPFCRRHAQNTAPSIIKDYVETGKVRYGISELPLERLHPQAFKLGQAAICGGQQGKYWTMHDLFFEKKVTDVEASAKTAKLDMQKFNQCMADKATEQQVRNSIKTATKLGIRGTPGFILGKTNTKNLNNLHALKSMRGALPYSSFQAEIDALLK